MIQPQPTGVGRYGPGCLDASFWNAAFQAGALGYALQFHNLHAPTAVEREINSEPPPRQRPKAAMFNALRATGGLQITDPAQITVNVYGPGDRAVLSLGRERSWPVLVNDARPHGYARLQLGLDAVSVPELLVLAVHAGWLPKGEGLAMLQRIAPITGATLMQVATLAISQYP
jgi:hypothetical protein